MTSDKPRWTASVAAGLLAVFASPPVRADPPPAEPAPEPIQVTVIGASDDALQRVPGSVQRVTANDLRRAQPADSGEMLRRVSGVHVRTEEGAGLRLNVGIRGLDPTRSRRVLVLEDGIPVAINPYGEPDLYYSTPIERVRAIEIVKGSGSILFGPQTVGGVVNFLTINPPNKRTVVLEGQFGEHLYHKALGSYGDSVGDTRYIVQVMNKGGDGIRNMGFMATDVLGKISFATSKLGEATLKIAFYDETSHATYVGLTKSMFEANPRAPTLAQDDRFDVRRYDVSLTHDQPISDKTRLRTLLFGYQTDRVWRRQNYDREQDPTVTYARTEGDPRELGSAIFFRNDSTIRDRHYQVFGVEPSLEHRFETSHVRHTMTVGTRFLAEGARRREFVTQEITSDSGDLATDEKASTIGVAGYVSDRMAFTDYLLVTPGIRFEYARSTRAIGRSSESGTPTDVDARGNSDVTAALPGLGMVIGTPRFNVFAGIHHGFAPPRVSASITPQGTDVALDAERSINYEVGLRTAPTRWLKLEAAGFLINFSNQIVSGTLASGLESEFANGGSTRHMGGEGAATLALGRGLRLPVTLDLSGQYTFSTARFTGGLFDGKTLPYAPEHTFTAILDVEHGFGFGGQVAWSFVSDQFADEFNTIEADQTGRVGLIPAYHELDVAVRYHHKWTGLTASVTVKNLLDDVHIVSRLPDGIFTGGFRQITGGLRWER